MPAGYVNHCRENRCTKRSFFLVILLGFTQYLIAQSSTLPVITDVLPYTGPVGSEVTIAGANFDPLKSNDTVFFGGVRAYIISATSNSLVVTVPAGAVYAPISVTTAKGLMAFSHPFITV